MPKLMQEEFGPGDSLLWRILEGYKDDYIEGVVPKDKILNAMQVWLDDFNTDFTAEWFLQRCDEEINEMEPAQ